MLTNVPKVNTVDTEGALKSINDYLVKQKQELEYQLMNLDSDNINELKADYISAGTLEAMKIVGSYITSTTVEAVNIVGSVVTGNEIIGGTIQGAIIRGNEIYGGLINGTVISGTVINGGEVNGAVIRSVDPNTGAGIVLNDFSVEVWSDIGMLAGGLQYDVIRTKNNPRRMLLRTINNFALKIQSDSDMSIDAGTGRSIYQGHTVFTNGTRGVVAEFA